MQLRSWAGNFPVVRKVTVARSAQACPSLQLAGPHLGRVDVAGLAAAFCTFAVIEPSAAGNGNMPVGLAPSAKPQLCGVLCPTPRGSNPIRS